MSIQLIESTVDSSGDASDSDSSEDEDLSPILKRPRVYAAKVECCKCWRLGIPPTWLVLCGAIMVQVKTASIEEYRGNLKSFQVTPVLVTHEVFKTSLACQPPSAPFCGRGLARETTCSVTSPIERPSE